jgi:hypothetical protein
MSEWKLVQESEILRIARALEDLKLPCSDDPESKQAVRNGKYMSLSLIVRSWLSASPTPPEAQGESAWISVEDRLPDEGILVIAMETDGGIYKLKRKAISQYFWDDSDIYYYTQVTHWIPIPLIPSIEQREG